MKRGAAIHQQPPDRIAPFAGARIETLWPSWLTYLPRIAPFAGARIETYNHIFNHLIDADRPLRGGAD